MAITTSGTLLVGAFAAISVFDLPLLGFNRPATQLVAAAQPELVTTTTALAVVQPDAGGTGTAVTAPLVGVVAPAANPTGRSTQPPPTAVVTAPPAASASPTTTAAPPTTAAAKVTTTTAKPATTTTAHPGGCRLEGIATKGKYTTGGIEVEKGSNLDTKVTVTTTNTCSGPMTMQFESHGYTLTLSPDSGGTTCTGSTMSPCRWTGTIKKGALKGLGTDQTLTATLSVAGANAKVNLKTVVESGSSGSS